MNLLRKNLTSFIMTKILSLTVGVVLWTVLQSLTTNGQKIGDKTLGLEYKYH